MFAMLHITKDIPNYDSTFQTQTVRKKLVVETGEPKGETSIRNLLPPLPTWNSWGSSSIFKNTYNINLFDYEIRRRYDVSSIPQYNYGYAHAIQLYRLYNINTPTIVEDVTHNTKANVRYSISKKDQGIINDPDIFLRRTLPPDNDSNTTMSDNSYVSAAGSVATVIYPPTPAHE
ncbi:hypothetical protein RhiirB3_431896 [Rhizophagus irregularis]|nr:hypothetical protein RhiirB3_431896 [Rhizophagus irregularis]